MTNARRNLERRDTSTPANHARPFAAILARLFREGNGKKGGTDK